MENPITRRDALRLTAGAGGITALSQVADSAKKRKKRPKGNPKKHDKAGEGGHQHNDGHNNHGANRLSGKSIPLRSGIELEAKSVPDLLHQLDPFGDHTATTDADVKAMVNRMAKQGQGITLELTQQASFFDIPTV